MPAPSGVLRLQRFQVADEVRRFPAGEVIDALIEPVCDPRFDLCGGVPFLLADGKNGGNLLPAGAAGPRRCAVGLCRGMRACSQRHGREGFVATLHVRGVPLCCSPDREVEERRYDRLQRP